MFSREAKQDPGGVHERRADRAAERVTGGSGLAGGARRRIGRLPRLAGGEVGVPGIVGEVVSSPGRPLDPESRGFMEPRFGHDFSRVRIHSDSRAAASAEALGAIAYTAGSHVVFGHGWHAPREPWGARLLAHELAHFVQQGDRRAGEPCPIQRVPIRATRSSVSIYELRRVGSSRRQVRTTRTSGGRDMRLSYDPATGVFTVTFLLVWLCNHSVLTSDRTAYATEFARSVRRVWNDRFLLTETVAPRRTAHVEIAFDHHVIPRMASAAHEQAQLTLPAARRRWVMDVRRLDVRESLNRATGVVRLGKGSMTPRRQSARELRAQAPFSYSGTGGNRTFTQAAAPHEFGHMIGLGDEYLEDVAGASVPRAVRGHINDRIMNVGENVTPDAYAPFAEWLSSLTSTRWRVGSRVPRRTSGP